MISVILFLNLLDHYLVLPNDRPVDVIEVEFELDFAKEDHIPNRIVHIDHLFVVQSNEYSEGNLFAFVNDPLVLADQGMYNEVAFLERWIHSLRVALILCRGEAIT